MAKHKKDDTNISSIIYMLSMVSSNNKKTAVSLKFVAVNSVFIKGREYLVGFVIPSI